MRLKLFLVLLLAVPGFAQQSVVPGSILGSLTPITSSNGTLNAVFPVVINTGAPAVLVQLDQTTTITAGAIRFQVSYDGTNFVNASADAVTDPTSTTNATISMPYTLQASTNKAFSVALKGAQALQILVSTAMTGTGAITPYYSVQPIPADPRAKILGSSGSIDAAGENAAAPTSEVIVGGKYDLVPTPVNSSGNVSPFQITEIGDVRVLAGGSTVSAFSAVSATSSRTSSSFNVASAFGTLSVSYSGITGAPSGCTIQQQIVASALSGASVISWTGNLSPSGSTQTFAVNPNGLGSVLNAASAYGVSFVYACSVYPTNGTFSTAFVTAQGITLSGANGNAALVNSSGQLSTQASMYDAASNGLTSNSTTYSSKFGLDGNLLGTLGTAFSTAGKVDIKAADGDDAALGAKADAKSTATDTTPITAISVLKEISAMEQAPVSRAVTNAGTFAVEAAESDGANVTIGAKADAKSTSTDTTPITAMSVLKEISAMEQAPASRAVTNAGTFAVQDTLQAGSAIAGKFGIDQTTPGTTNAIEPVPDTASAVALTTTTKSSLTSASNVKSSAGNVYGLFASNGAAAQCWVQVINNAGAGTLGTGVIFSVPMASSGSVVIPPGTFAMANFSSGISVGIASTTNAASACGTAGTVVLFYK